jgi:hypothetical protein
MSYGFYRLSKRATTADYIAAVAKQKGFQGIEMTMLSSNTPGDDQSMPQMSQSMPANDPTINDPTEIDVRSQGYTGDVCSHCQGSRMRWAGHCQVCEDCGESSGCS